MEVTGAGRATVTPLLGLLLTASSMAQLSTAPFHGSAIRRQGASFAHPVTGVTSSKEGRSVVNYPRWTEATAFSTVEVMCDGHIRPRSDDARCF